MQSIANFSNSNVTKQNFKEICRSCLRKPGLFNIFNTKLQKHFLKDAINTCFGVEISFSDKYSANICGDCLKHILYSIIFIRRLRNNQNYMRELQLIFENIYEDFEQTNYINEEIYTNALLIDDFLKNEDEFQYLRRTETILNIFEHSGINTMNKNNGQNFETIEDIDASAEENIINDECVKTEPFPIFDEDQLEITEIKCEFQDPESTENCNVTSYSSSIHCPTNLNTTPDPVEIITIVGEEPDVSRINNDSKVQNTTKLTTITKEKSQWQCFECLENFETLKSLIQHSKETGHTMPPRFQCELCFKSFKTAKAYKSHSLRHVQVRMRSICDICGASVLQRNFKRHLLGHDDKANVCQYCGKSFVQAGTLALHVKNLHEGKRRVSLCCICGKVCANTSILTTHLNTHSKEELKDVAYGCEECGKYLVSEDSLYLHIQKLHVNPVKRKTSEIVKKTRVVKEKKKYVYGPKVCPVCSKTISYIGYAAHLRIHANIKPYECKICSQTFKQQAHLRTHMNIHLDVKPYECRFCKKMFRHLTSRRTHERAHKGEKPFKCPVCDKGFYESSPMKKHLRIHSKDPLKTEDVEDDIYIRSEVF